MTNIGASNGLRVYELMRSGELGSMRIGASRRVPRQALDAFIEQKMLTAP